MTRIDAHTHFADDSPQALRMLAAFDLKLLNICVAQRDGDWRLQAATYARLAQSHPKHFSWCTSFDLPDCEAHDFDATEYVGRVVAQLKEDFDGGAVACKVWKNIGMELKDARGDFVLVDNPLFAPIFDFLAAHDKPLLMHIGEPRACWEPLSPDSPHFGYYSGNPQWHMAGRDDAPSHEALIAARDNVIGAHPKLRVIGAHLGSLEWDVSQIAQRLDKYPNFAVDISARLADLAYQERDKVRRFLLDYADRVLFGTDIVFWCDENSDAEQKQSALDGHLRDEWESYFGYLSTNETQRIGEREVRGLGLPDDVLQLICSGNARDWYAGL